MVVVRGLLLVLAAAISCHGFAPPAGFLSRPSTLSTTQHRPVLPLFVRHPTPLYDANTDTSLTTENETSNTANKDLQDGLPKEASPDSTPDFLPSRPASHYDALICGGGPAGLLAALMLAQTYGPSYKIAVCEQRAALPPSPSDATVWSNVARFYLLGIGHRGQTALQRFGVMEDFRKASVQVDGRRDWQPGMTRVQDGRITPSTKDPPSRVLARDKLVGVLHEHLVQNYIQPDNPQCAAHAIDLLYGYQVEPVDFGVTNQDPVSVRISKCQDVVSVDATESESYQASQDSQQLCNVDDESVLVTTNFLIGADGAARTVAAAMEEADHERYQQLNPLRRLFAKRPLKVTKFDDDNPRVYKSVPIALPKDWPAALNYSARSKNNRITLEALPSDNNGNLCALLLMKPDDPLAQPNVDPATLRKFFNEEFPQFGALVDDVEMARVAQKPASRLPAFRFVGPRLHVGARTLVLGDAAHTVKPYYGLGANTALEDVQVLQDMLKESAAHDDPIPKAVSCFSKRRAGDAQALVTISRNMDRPGKWFLVNFLLPLILDGIFHKLAPRIFSPNIFGMFQKKGIGFLQIQRKKRFDRALQLACIATALTGVGVLVRTAIQRIAQVTGRSQSAISFGMLLLGVAGAVLQKISKPKSATASSG